MSKFTDDTGQDWNIKLTIKTVRDVQSKLAINLLESAEGEFLNNISKDMILLCDILEVVCADQITSRNVDFAECLSTGDTLEKATQAFLEELANFFQGAKKALMQKTLEKINKAEEMAYNKALTEVEKMDIQQIVNEHFQKSLID